MITYSVYSDVGNRAVNEDSYQVADLGEKMLFVVADGLGGHGRGEMASGLVTEVMNGIFDKKCSIKNFLEESVMVAQDMLLQRQKELNAKNQMKTTVVALMIDKNKAKWIHCGDSRLYRFYKNSIAERTLDHSIPQMLVRTKDITEEEIRFHPERNIILKVVGTKWDEPEYEVSNKIKLKKCQAFLLCTDGFWEFITEDYMISLLQESSTVDEWLNSMIDIVKSTGNGKDMDNNTAIAVWCS